MSGCQLLLSFCSEGPPPPRADEQKRRDLRDCTKTTPLSEHANSGGLVEATRQHDMISLVRRRSSCCCSTLPRSLSKARALVSQSWAASTLQVTHRPTERPSCYAQHSLATCSSHSTSAGDSSSLVDSRTHARSSVKNWGHSPPPPPSPPRTSSWTAATKPPCGR